MPAPVLGAVLAGGQSRRFGSDKALAIVAGKPLIEHAIDALSGHVTAIVVCGRAMPGRVSLPDRPHAGLGPLGGLCAALRHATDHGFGGVLTTACDMPYLGNAIGHLPVGPAAAVLESEWLVGYWPARLSSLLDAHLASSDDRSMRAWAKAAGAATIAWPVPLPNINTPDDLADVARDFDGRRPAGS